MEKKIRLKPINMDRDSEVSIIENTSSYDNYNVRFTSTSTSGSNIESAITNERGTLKLVGTSADAEIKVPGTPLGYTSIEDYIVVFSKMMYTDEYSSDNTGPSKVAGHKIDGPAIVVNPFKPSKFDPLPTYPDFMEDFDNIEAELNPDVIGGLIPPDPIEPSDPGLDPDPDQESKFRYHDVITIFKVVSYLQDESVTTTLSKYYEYRCPEAGEFNFNIKYPIDCQCNYERQDIIKVYWVDGLNPFRMLMIPKKALEGKEFEEVHNSFFNVIKPFGNLRSESGKETITDIEDSITVEKQVYGGTFPAGTIQYAFTYYTKYGQESNIFKVTPLYYLTSSDSGTPKDRNTNCCFNITIKAVPEKDNNWNFIRIYSIVRTDLNGEVVCKRVADISIDDDEFKQITYTDTGLYGETVDSTRLLYVGGETIIPEVIAQKDNTLFLANYSIQREELPENFKQQFRRLPIEFKIDDKKIVDIIPNAKLSSDIFYEYNSQLLKNSQEITTFKGGESYRFGVQLQDSVGRWSEPIFIGDVTNTKYPQKLTKSSSPSRLISNSGQLAENFQYNTEKDFWEVPGGSSGSGTGGSTSTPHPSLNYAAPQYMLAYASTNITENTINQLLAADADFFKKYKRIRPIIVYPNEGQQEILFQGVANPTIKRIVNNKYEYSMPSWFFRGRIFGEEDIFQKPFTDFKGILPTNGHGQAIGYFSSFTPGDVESGITSPTEDDYLNYYNAILRNNIKAEFQLKPKETDYIIDWNTLTINSPDIQFNEQLSLVDLRTAKINIVGFIGISGFAGCYDIQYDGPLETIEYKKDEVQGRDYSFGDTLGFPGKYMEMPYAEGKGGMLLNFPLWVDAVSDHGEGGRDQFVAKWYVYPWNRNGSLNNSTGTLSNVEGIKPSVLKKKTLSNSRFSPMTVYTLGMEGVGYYTDNAELKIFNQSSEVQTTRFQDASLFRNKIDIVQPAIGVPSFISEYDVKYDKDGVLKNKINVYTYTPQVFESKVGYLEAYSIDKSDSNVVKVFENPYQDEDAFFYSDLMHDFKLYNATDNPSSITKGEVANHRDSFRSYDPIPIQFKSGSNCVVKLGTPSDNPYPWGYLSNAYEALGDKKVDVCMLPIIQVQREILNKFGGTSEDAIKQNPWLVAGPSVSLSDTNPVTLEWLQGDTYFQRYDCLKTMPLKDSAVNNIIEILSFMCETRVNIDGRYDNNRGLKDNTSITAENFNQINNVYSQKDNYFEYYAQDFDQASLNKYSNQIIWSLTQQPGEEIDPWTNVTLLNSLNLDGDKGPVNAIKNLNGQLYAFQDKAISRINFNQNTMINPQDGVPIEVANSGKVQGTAQISSSKGCINKWAISDMGGQGLMFLDSLNKALNVFDGEKIIDVGQKARFQSWIRANCSIDRWNPTWTDIAANTMIMHYDKDAKEVLLTTHNQSVAFNLDLFGFTSFYSYANVPWLINNKGLQVLLDPNGYFWKMRSADLNNYCSFFDNVKDFYVNMFVTDGQNFDTFKRFNNVEVRDNTLAVTDGQFTQNYPFNSIQAATSYQISDPQELVYTQNKDTNLIPKFRVWRIDIPRDKAEVGRIANRMSDHYLKLKLAHTNKENIASRIHNLTVSYES